MKNILIIALLCVCGYVGAADLRGKIQTIQPVTNDTINLPNTPVSLFSQGEDKKWVNLGSAITNAEGFYFFKDVAPGTYYIQVNKKKNFKIEVKNETNKSKIQDLPLIVY